MLKIKLNTDLVFVHSDRVVAPGRGDEKKGWRCYSKCWGKIAYAFGFAIKAEYKTKSGEIKVWYINAKSFAKRCTDDTFFEGQQVKKYITKVKQHIHVKPAAKEKTSSGLLPRQINLELKVLRKSLEYLLKEDPSSNKNSQLSHFDQICEKHRNRTYHDVDELRKAIDSAMKKGPGKSYNILEVSLIELMDDKNNAPDEKGEEIVPDKTTRKITPIIPEFSTSTKSDKAEDKPQTNATSKPSVTEEQLQLVEKLRKNFLASVLLQYQSFQLRDTAIGVFDRFCNEGMEANLVSANDFLHYIDNKIALDALLNPFRMLGDRDIFKGLQAQTPEVDPKAGPKGDPVSERFQLVESLRLILIGALEEAYRVPETRKNALEDFNDICQEAIAPNWGSNQAFLNYIEAKMAQSGRLRVFSMVGERDIFKTLKEQTPEVEPKVEPKELEEEIKGLTQRLKDNLEEEQAYPGEKNKQLREDNLGFFKQICENSKDSRTMKEFRCSVNDAMETQKEVIAGEKASSWVLDRFNHDRNLTNVFNIFLLKKNVLQDERSAEFFDRSPYGNGAPNGATFPALYNVVDLQHVKREVDQKTVQLINIFGKQLVRYLSGDAHVQRRGLAFMAFQRICDAAAKKFPSSVEDFCNKVNILMFNDLNKDLIYFTKHDKYDIFSIKADQAPTELEGKALELRDNLERQLNLAYPAGPSIKINNAIAAFETICRIESKFADSVDGFCRRVNHLMLTDHNTTLQSFAQGTINDIFSLKADPVPPQNNKQDVSNEIILKAREALKDNLGIQLFHFFPGDVSNSLRRRALESFDRICHTAFNQHPHDIEKFCATVNTLMLVDNNTTLISFARNSKYSIFNSVIDHPAPKQNIYYRDMHHPVLDNKQLIAKWTQELKAGLEKKYDPKKVEKNLGFFQNICSIAEGLYDSQEEFIVHMRNALIDRETYAANKEEAKEWVLEEFMDIIKFPDPKTEERKLLDDKEKRSIIEEFTESFIKELPSYFNMETIVYYLLEYKKTCAELLGKPLSEIELKKELESFKTRHVSPEVIPGVMKPYVDLIDYFETVQKKYRADKTKGLSVIADIIFEAKDLLDLKKVKSLGYRLQKMMIIEEYSEKSLVTLIISNHPVDEIVYIILEYKKFREDLIKQKDRLDVVKEKCGKFGASLLETLKKQKEEVLKPHAELIKYFEEALSKPGAGRQDVIECFADVLIKTKDINNLDQIKTEISSYANQIKQ